MTGLDDEFRTAALAGKPPLYGPAIDNPPGARDAAVVNGAAWRAAEVPAVNGHGTARAVAGLYTAQCAGPDQVFGHDNAWGLGFGVYGDGEYGMGGLGGSFGGATPAYTVAFLTGSMGDHDRADHVENAVRECLGMPPLEDQARRGRPGRLGNVPGPHRNEPGREHYSPNGSAVHHDVDRFAKAAPRCAARPGQPSLSPDSSKVTTCLLRI